MGSIMSINTEKARLEPEAIFDVPGAVVEEPGLTRGQKIAALERWRATLLDRIRATGEGMAPAPGDTANEAATLEEISRALDALRSTPPPHAEAA